jgi:hypothetical protein
MYRREWLTTWDLWVERVGDFVPLGCPFYRMLVAVQRVQQTRGVHAGTHSATKPAERRLQ